MYLTEIKMPLILDSHRPKLKTSSSLICDSSHYILETEKGISTTLVLLKTIDRFSISDLGLGGGAGQGP